MTPVLITVNTPGLTYVCISVQRGASVAMAEHQVGSQVWWAILVDGHYYDLVLAKHIDGRPELVAAFNAVLAEVEQAAAIMNASVVEQMCVFGLINHSSWAS